MPHKNKVKYPVYGEDETVTIPTALYEELVDYKKRFLAQQAKRKLGGTLASKMLKGNSEKMRALVNKRWSKKKSDSISHK